MHLSRNTFSFLPSDAVRKIPQFCGWKEIEIEKKMRSKQETKFSKMLITFFKIITLSALSFQLYFQFSFWIIIYMLLFIPWFYFFLLLFSYTHLSFSVCFFLLSFVFIGFLNNKFFFLISLSFILSFKLIFLFSYF